MEKEGTNLIDLKDKKVGILGLGEENLALFSYLNESDAKITLCDGKRRGELKEQLG